MGKGGVEDAGGSGEWLPRTCGGVVSGQAVVRQLNHFGGASGMGKGGAGMPVGVGSGCRELVIELFPDGPTFDN